MTTHNFRFIFHLYSPDPTLAFPVLDEDGEWDVEFVGNHRDRLANLAMDEILKIDSNVHIDQALSTEDELEAHIVFDGRTSRYVLDLVTDFDNWPQRDEGLSKQRLIEIQNKNLGQRWWIHHITMPDNSELDCDVVNKKVELAIENYFQKEKENRCEKINSV